MTEPSILTIVNSIVTSLVAAYIARERYLQKKINNSNPNPYKDNPGPGKFRDYLTRDTFDAFKEEFRQFKEDSKRFCDERHGLHKKGD